MKLVYFRDRVPNFGDELNTYIWPALLPAGFLDEDESELFIGIGSILGDHLPRAARKFVVGSGHGGYTGIPDMNDGSWRVQFVRGPRTAEMLGLPAETAICDSAVLLRAMERLPPPAGNIGTAFMPHFQSLERGLWAEACRLAGVTLIDPTAPVETVLAQLQGARLLITEAMHGAIVADALRVPWIAARPLFWGHHRKWLDWSQAVGVDLRFHALRPTTLLELYVLRTGRGGNSGRALAVSRSRFAALPNRTLTHLAARNLEALTREAPQQSADPRIAEVTARAEAALDRLIRSRANAVT
jgi:succinoglycan biosynthesis protein ExoV